MRDKMEATKDSEINIQEMITQSHLMKSQATINALNNLEE